MPSRDALSKCDGGLGPWSCSSTSQAWIESSMRFSVDLTKTGKPTPSNYLHRQLDVTFRGIRNDRRKTPGLKTRAKAIAHLKGGCCSPPLQRRGLLQGHPPRCNFRLPYFRSRNRAVNLAKRLPEVCGSEGLAASAVSFTFFIAPGG